MDSPPSLVAGDGACRAAASLKLHDDSGRGDAARAFATKKPTRPVQRALEQGARDDGEVVDLCELGFGALGVDDDIKKCGS